MTTQLYDQVFGSCCRCGFSALIVGGLVPCQMIGHNGTSSGIAPELVWSNRCIDVEGCERRQRDFVKRPWTT